MIAVPRTTRLHRWNALARMVNPSHRRPRKLPRQLQPDAIRASYLVALRRLVLEPARSLVMRYVLARYDSLRLGIQTHADSAHADSVEDISAAVQDAKREFAKDVPRPRMRALARTMGRHTDAFQAAQLNRQVRSAIGVDVVGNPYERSQRLEDFAAENVALISSVSDEYFSRIEKSVIRSARTGERAEDLADQLQADYDVSDSRAKLIARDQIGKLYADYQQERQRDLGVESYIWRTMEDERVRDSHADQDGEEYEWNDPPTETGHPGEDYQCRCYAEPVLTQLLEE